MCMVSIEIPKQERKETTLGNFLFDRMQLPLGRRGGKLVVAEANLNREQLCYYGEVNAMVMGSTEHSRPQLQSPEHAR